MSIPELLETHYRDRTTPKVFQRGEQYYHSGAVVSCCSRGNTIQATVEGNEVEPYRVNLQFDRAGIKQANCTCAYTFEGWCKHIVATALLCLHQPETIQERPSLEQLLDQLNLVQTQGLIQKLVAKQPELIDDIDNIVTQITQPIPQAPIRAKRQTSVNPQPYRSQVKSLMRNALRYWEEGYEDNPIEEELPDILAQAQAFSEQGDGNNALVILEAITQACTEDWDDLVEYGGDSDYLMSLLDPVWAEAILSAEFQPGEEVDLQINLEDWQDRLGATFNLASAALRQGWDDLALQAVLRGESTDLWEDNRPDDADQLTRIRLSILERQQRQEEYLNLARAEAIEPEYLTMLTRLGRVDEVMAQKNQLTCVEQALEVAKALREQDAIPEALLIAQHGLTLPESMPSHSYWATLSQYKPLGIHRYQLADWTSNLAEGLGEQKAALSARIEAFKAQPSFKDYQSVQHLAGENWLTVQGDLLEHLRQCDSWSTQEAQVDIFLHEKLIDDAIAALGRYCRDPLIHRVMDVAIFHRPEWVIEQARHHAEDIINQGKAKAYDAAVEWLQKARAAYFQLGQQSEWNDYRTQLMTTHARKYKLMGLLKTI
ncbi:MAG: SWIM zinc finger family protein [Coleofasciculus sp. A1-SPW-01]|uniref:SWIM zinc finger family protein n=1 Tax=Coleofasciculus sp. A1-SPW-01 TaxID=3070819 RepID=UPI0032F0C548